ncbi:MAG: glycine--tRNA ligase subunit beta [Elusimicrobiota bacterium]
MKKELIFEIGVEELPLSAQRTAGDNAKSLFKNIMDNNSITYDDINVFITPCRIVIEALNVDEAQRVSKEEIIGPPKRIAYDENGKPTNALKGFAEKCGVAVKDLKFKETSKGEYITAEIVGKSEKTEKILPKIFNEFIITLNFPKTMVWNKSKARFSRPVRWLLGMFGNKALSFECAGIKSGKITYGMSGFRAKKINVKNRDDYHKKLLANSVVIDRNKRKEMVINGFKGINKKYGIPIIHEDLLDEVSALTEYPFTILGSFDKRFLQLPAEVIVTVLKHHQKFFALETKDGKLTPHFIGVKNGRTKYEKIVCQGYEKVLTARLKDAEFFYMQDRKKKLIDRVDDLKKVVYQEQLGSVYDKVNRIQKISEMLVNILKIDADNSRISRIALLAKTDLLTEMVQEFPELQGVMGRVYAQDNGEDELTASAIEENYLPKTAGDKLPRSNESAIVSIADKIDNVVSTFLTGHRPKGSYDPYGMRRQFYGVFEICLDKKWDLSFFDLAKNVSALFENKFSKESIEEAVSALNDFYKKRFENWLIDKQFSVDEVRSISERESGILVHDDYLKLSAIHDMRKDKDFEQLIALYKRAHNIVRQAKDKGFNFADKKIDENLFAMQEEKNLWNSLQQVVLDDKLQGKKKYVSFLQLLAKLKPALDTFFDNVLIMDKDESVRNNRLVLLTHLTNTFSRIADFSQIV